jgi:hypothetical protein
MNKSFIYFFLILLLSILIIAITYFYYINFHLLNRNCHKNAFHWENKEFFTNHCVCNPGFIGDGKTECSRCGLSSMNQLIVLIVQEYYYIYLSENNTKRNFSYSKKTYGTLLSKNLIAASSDSLRLVDFQDETIEMSFIKSENYSKIEDTLRAQVDAKSYSIKKIHRNSKYCNELGLIYSKLILLELEGFVENISPPCLTMNNHNLLKSLPSKRYVMIGKTDNLKGFTSCSVLINYYGEIDTFLKMDNEAFPICNKTNMKEGLGLFHFYKNATYLQGISVKKGYSDIYFTFIESNLNEILWHLSRN